MSIGTIRRLIRGRGFGFIASNGGKDIFFHYSRLQGTEFQLLREGQSVNFKVGLCPKGFEAVDVKLSGKPLTQHSRHVEFVVTRRVEPDDLQDSDSTPWSNSRLNLASVSK